MEGWVSLSVNNLLKVINWLSVDWYVCWFQLDLVSRPWRTVVAALVGMGHHHPQGNGVVRALDHHSHSVSSCLHYSCSSAVDRLYLHIWHPFVGFYLSSGCWSFIFLVFSTGTDPEPLLSSDFQTYVKTLYRHYQICGNLARFRHPGTYPQNPPSFIW